MQLHEIKTNNKKGKTVGRGGKRGKTSGRGHKGQKARAGHSLRPEIRDLIKKIPKKRGHGRNRSRTFNPDRVKPFAVTLSALSHSFESGAEVTPQSLLENKLVRVKGNTLPPVKILGTGEVDKPLTVKDCVLTESARAKIEKAGGKIV